MEQRIAFFIAIASILSCTIANDSKHNRRERANSAHSSNKEDKYRSQLYAHEREPTTNRPNDGNSQNEDIDDYPDENSNVGTRQYPYGFNIGQISGFGGGNIHSGILVGPNGPTGIIGRPQQHFLVANSGFPSEIGGLGRQSSSGFPGQVDGGFKRQPEVGLSGQAGGNALPGSSTGQFRQGVYSGAPTSLNNAIGQYVGQYPSVHYIRGQYPVGQSANGQYPGGQSSGGQFPGGPFPEGPYQGVHFPGSQYSGGQYTGGGRPQYTEGYGLVYNNGYPSSSDISPYSSIAGTTSFDEYDNAKQKLQLEGKNEPCKVKISISRK